MEWYLQVLKKYAVFTSRARRKEYWMFVLFNALISGALTVVDDVTGMRTTDGVGALSTLYALGVLIPGIAVAIRRLHDTGRSGWWLLIAPIPIVDLVLFAYLVTDSQPGPNQYGPNPKEIGEMPGVRPGAAPSTAAVTSPAGWLPDPTGRHQLRYWDSARWTEHVSDAGVTSVDPIGT